VAALGGRLGLELLASADAGRPADVCKQQGLALRGHVLVWPSERNLPNSIKALLPTRDPSVPAKVLAHIDDVVTATQGLLGEWDVLNEPYDNHDLMDFYGSSVMADWFRRAHERHPAARLYINDYSILSGGGLNVAHQNHYEQTIRTILNAGAPLHGIGFQGHFEGAPTGMQKVWSLLERYSGAFPGVVFKITEFDVDTEDEALQADYTRDLLTLVFSHPQAAGFPGLGLLGGIALAAPGGHVPARLDREAQRQGLARVDQRHLAHR
jgi:endo-1,4-beta-xylanase